MWSFWVLEYDSVKLLGTRALLRDTRVLEYDSVKLHRELEYDSVKILSTTVSLSEASEY